MIKSIFLFHFCHSLVWWPSRVSVWGASDCMKSEMDEKRTVIVPNELPFFMNHHHISFWSFCEPVIFGRFRVSVSVSPFFPVVFLFFFAFLWFCYLFCCCIIRFFFLSVLYSIWFAIIACFLFFLYSLSMRMNLCVCGCLLEWKWIQMYISFTFVGAVENSLDNIFTHKRRTTTKKKKYTHTHRYCTYVWR